MTDADAWQKKMDEDEDWSVLHWDERPHPEQFKFDDKMPLFSAQTIENAAQRYCSYLDHVSKEELGKDEKQQLEDVKNEIRNFAAKISNEISFGETHK